MHHPNVPSLDSTPPVLKANVALPRHQHPAAEAFEPGIDGSFGMEVSQDISLMFGRILRGLWWIFWWMFVSISADAW